MFKARVELSPLLATDVSAARAGIRFYESPRQKPGAASAHTPSDRALELALPETRALEPRVEASPSERR